MNILIATPLFPPAIGGPATYSKVLSDALPKQGISIRIADFGAVRWLPRGIRHAAYFLVCLWRGRGADVIYAQDPFSVGFPALLAARILRKKFALKVVGDYAWEIFQRSAAIFVSPDDFQHGRYDLVTEIRRAVEHFTVRRARAVVVPSEYLKRIVAGWGARPDAIHVIPNAFDGAECPLTQEDARKKYRLDGTLFLSAGRLVPWKGFGTLVELMPDIIREIPDARLVIAGDGEEREALEFAVRALGLQERVLLLGRVAHAELAGYIRAADLFVLNTGYEGLSHQLLEVLALKTPVITTTIGGNPEIVRDGDNGVLVDYDDRGALKAAIVRLAKDGEERRRFSERGPETVRTFTRERMVARIAALLNDL
ncbi:MAG: glycosyltransferase family 4 protein [Candidatus Niyogibacteria bacterium]|nr:glycosyltransferase family 4 protein [Candidatus Niyogibacteria bacterium]